MFAEGGNECRGFLEQKRSGGMIVDLAGRSFPSKTQASSFFRAMLYRYQPGQRIDDNDARHLRALLEWHTEYEEKVGLGIDHFSVMWAEGECYATRCFCVIRGDGTQIDFSYRHCIRSITNRAFAALLRKETIPNATGN
jgi:Protein of unknown function (DUF3223)